MADVFNQEDALKLLNHKFVVIIGDSVQRGVYKDLVCLLQSNQLLTKEHLKLKGEVSHCQDERIEYEGKTKGKWYREVRQYRTDHHLIRYYFVTRCYSNYMETILCDLSKDPGPDIVMMNSCLWDISRYGSDSMSSYKDNLKILHKRLAESLPRKCHFIWLTTLPVSRKINAPFIPEELSFLDSVLCILLKEANWYAMQAADAVDVDVLDLNWYFRNQVEHRSADGVHWNNIAHRRITHHIMTHLCISWGINLPSYFKNTVVPRLEDIDPMQLVKRHQRSVSMDARIPTQVAATNNNSKEMPNCNFYEVVYYHNSNFTFGSFEQIQQQIQNQSKKDIYKQLQLDKVLSAVQKKKSKPVKRLANVKPGRTKMLWARSSFTRKSFNRSFSRSNRMALSRSSRRQRAKNLPEKHIMDSAFKAIQEVEAVIQTLTVAQRIEASNPGNSLQAAANNIWYY